MQPLNKKKLSSTEFNYRKAIGMNYHKFLYTRV